MKFPFVVVLDNIRSALNVGAIFRTCDGGGAEKLYLCGITPEPTHHKIQKTALGAQDYMPWEKSASTIDTVNKLKAEGYTIFAVEQTERSAPFDKIEYPKKTALVFGHEISGIDPHVLALADEHIQVPMFGHKNSLNVATTVGIVCYHVALEQRKKASP